MNNNTSDMKSVKNKDALAIFLFGCLRRHDVKQAFSNFVEYN